MGWADRELFCGARIKEWIAQPFVKVELCAGCLQAGEINLVDGDDGRQFVGLCNHQKAVQHAQMRLRVLDGKDDQDLVGIGDDHIFGRAASFPEIDG